MGMLEAARSRPSGARCPVPGSLDACGMKLRGLKSGVTTGQSASRTAPGVPTTGQPAHAEWHQDRIQDSLIPEPTRAEGYMWGHGAAGHPRASQV